MFFGDLTWVICTWSLQESCLVRGVAFQKAFSYAGFEMQPKHYKVYLLVALIRSVSQNPLVALLNIELELKAEKDNAEMRIKDVKDYQAVSFIIGFT